METTILLMLLSYTVYKTINPNNPKVYFIGMTNKQINEYIRFRVSIDPEFFIWVLMRTFIMSIIELVIYVVLLWQQEMPVATGMMLIIHLFYFLHGGFSFYRNDDKVFTLKMFKYSNMLLNLTLIIETIYLFHVIYM